MNGADKTMQDLQLDKIISEIECLESRLDGAIKRSPFGFETLPSGL
ncbi:MAG: hypothetical protein ACMUIG_06090 [Thermoplasmatota archaeon]